MPDSEESDDERESSVSRLVDVPLSVDLLDLPSLPNLQREFEALVDDTPVHPTAVEDALGDVDAPGLTDADVEASVLPGGIVDEDAVDSGADAVVEDAVDSGADAVVEAGGEAVAVTAETAGETARVVVDSGADAVEVVVEGGGEAAAEATVELVAAALDGL